tara:strand:- start:1022 stop:1204 length:183 start_codon:yes stop_codon:yes gene_type:complete
MEASINTFKFKLDRIQDVIEVFDGPVTGRPAAYIKVSHEIDEKTFHMEISDWYMNDAPDF